MISNGVEMDFLSSQLCGLESFVLCVCVCFYYDAMWSDKHSWIMLKQADHEKYLQRPSDGRRDFLSGPTDTD